MYPWHVSALWQLKAASEIKTPKGTSQKISPNFDIKIATKANKTADYCNAHNQHFGLGHTLQT